MNTEQIERLRELAKKAKPGYVLSPESEKANFDYIVACDPQIILALIEENDRLRAEVARIELAEQAQELGMGYDGTPVG